MQRRWTTSFGQQLSSLSLHSEGLHYVHAHYLPHQHGTEIFLQTDQPEKKHSGRFHFEQNA